MMNENSPITTLTWLLIGTIFILLLILTLILYVKLHLKKMDRLTNAKNELKLEHQRQLLQNSIHTQEHERSRIASNIHDDLIGQLHRIKLINEDQSINTLLNASIKTARLISHDLVPPLINSLSFQTLVKEYMLPFGEKYDLSFCFNNYAEEDLKAMTKLHLFRIVQEVTTNCLKHAKASSIAIYCRISEKYICLKVSDNGIGFSTEKTKGAGLKNIESRNQVINGIYRIETAYGKGTTFFMALKK